MLQEDNASMQTKALHAPFASQMRCTIRRLHDRLAEIDRCFVRGSFVWELKPRTKFGKRLWDALTTLSTPRPIARTHRHFMRASNQSTQMELGIDPPMQFLCDAPCRSSHPSQSSPPPSSDRCTKGKRTPKTVLLWYAFRRGSRTFLFLKLEGSKGMSVSHMIQAFRKYVFGTEFNGGGYPYRAETKPISKTHLMQNRLGLNRWLDRAFRTERQRTQVRSRLQGILDEYDQTVRVGNEMFVPWLVLERELRFCMK